MSWKILKCWSDITVGGVVVEIDYPQCIGDSDKIRIYKLTKPDSVTREGILHIFRNNLNKNL